jgi:hypothetical protein
MPLQVFPVHLSSVIGPQRQFRDGFGLARLEGGIIILVHRLGAETKHGFIYQHHEHISRCFVRRNTMGRLDGDLGKYQRDFS